MKKFTFFAFFWNLSKVIGHLFCIFAQNFKDMLIYLIIIAAILLTIYMTWKTYKVSGSIGGAFLIFLFCIGATPFIAWIIYGELLRDWYDSTIYHIIHRLHCAMCLCSQKVCHSHRMRLGSWHNNLFGLHYFYPFDSLDYWILIWHLKNSQNIARSTGKHYQAGLIIAGMGYRSRRKRNVRCSRT